MVKLSHAAAPHAAAPAAALADASPQPAGAARIVVTRRIFEDQLAVLRQRYTVIDNQADGVLAPAELQARMAQAQGVLVDPAGRIDGPLLAHCPLLRVVSNIAVGYNNIDVEACTRAGILVTNTPDVLTQATADHAWALLMAAARRVVESDRWTRAGHWQGFALDSFLGADVYGATLGILGMGRIGSAIADRARGFSMPVIYHNRKAPQAVADDPLAPRWVERDVLFAQADFLVLVLPYSPATHHVVGATELARMKPGAVLVNIARGGIVDDAALVAALRAGRPGAAALDVMENEPRMNEQLPLLDNIVLTPHIGSATTTARRGMVRLALDNLAAALGGQRPAALVNPQAWEGRRTS